MHVLIAGCGWLGQALAAALLARGDRVTGVRRDPTGLAALGITPLALDLADPASGAQLPDDAEAIIACQAAGGGGDTVEAYRRAYLDVNRTLGTRRLPYVYTSSTGVFGQHDGGDVDEDTPPLPASPTAEVLALAEREVLAHGRVVRLSGLYGPGRYGVIERVRSGRLALGPGDDAWTAWCHLDDAVQVVLAALDRGRDGAIYHGSDAHPTRRREVVEHIAARLGIPAPSSTTSGGRGGHRRILAAKTRAALGVTLRYPSFREGLAVCLDGASQDR